MIVRATFVRSVLIAAALMLARATAGAADLVTVHVATSPVDGMASVYYARDMGFFKNAGLNVEIQAITNGAATVSAVASGAVDIGASNPSSIAIAYKRGIPLSIVAVGGVYNTDAPTSICMVTKNSTLHTAKDLDGKTIGTNGLRGVSEFAPRAWIDKNGGDSSTVKFLELPFAEMANALEGGRIDAAIIIEPLIPDAMTGNRLFAKCYDGIATHFALSGFFAMSAWAKAHPTVIAKFADVMRQTAIWANDPANHDRTAEILSRESHVSLDRIKRSVRSEYGVDVEPALFQPVIDVTAKYSGQFAPFPASELIYTR